MVLKQKFGSNFNNDYIFKFIMKTRHAPLQAYFREIFCHGLGISESTSFFMANPEKTIKIKSFIESKYPCSSPDSNPRPQIDYSN